ncbi:hypothetical protein MMC26_002475 [Xylographa opegraphella]|nr:hypothetical protein [Xylographa opegraphella]
MSVGFGFSFGDLVDAIRLVADVVAALKDSTGASAEFRELMSELYNLEIALIAVKNSDLPESSREYAAAKQAVGDCQACITKFLAEVAKYQQLSTGHLTMREQILAGHSPLREQILKIKWARCHKDDVSNLRAKLASQTTVLNLLLNVIQISRSTTADSETYNQLKEQRKLIGEVHDRLERSDSDIQQLLTKIESLITSPPSYGAVTAQFSFEVRPLRLLGAPIAPDHVERKELMDSIEEALLPLSRERQRIVVLQGMGGIGKSQLARSYATKHQNSYSAIFWLDAKTEQSLKRSIAQISEQIPLPDVLDAGRRIRYGEAGLDAAAEAVFNWLCLKDNTDWLLVFDNVDRHLSSEKQEYELRGPSDSGIAAYDAYKYVPEVSHGSLLITSRLSFLSRAFGATGIRVNEMSRVEGIRLLSKVSRRSSDEPGIADLVERLGAYPLAISQAGRLMYEMQMSPSKYLQQYDMRFKTLLKTRPEAREYHNGSISTTLSLSYDQLVARNASAAAFLILCSYFDNSNIYYELLQAFTKAKSGLLFLQDDLPADPQLFWIPELSQTWLTEICENEDTYLNCITSLHELSFVRHNDRSDSVSIHPIVHEWSLHYGETTNKYRMLSTACNLLAATVPQIDPEVLGLAQSQIQPHVDRLYSLLPADLSYISASINSILAIATYYEAHGPTERAAILRNAAYINALSKFGPDHRCTLEACMSVALAKFEAGKYQEVLDDLQGKEASYCNINWEPSLSRQENQALASATMMSLFALCKQALGRLEDARGILTALKKLLPKLADTVVFPAVSCVYFFVKIVVPISSDEAEEECPDDTEDSVESLEHLLEMIENTKIWPQSLGSRVSAQANVLSVLGQQCQWEGDNVKGQTYLQKALNLYERLNGPSSPETLAMAREVVESGALLTAPLTMRDERWRSAIIDALGRVLTRNDASFVPESSLLIPAKTARAGLSHLRWVETLTTVRKAVKDRPKGQ